MTNPKRGAERKSNFSTSFSSRPHTLKGYMIGQRIKSKIWKIYMRLHENLITDHAVDVLSSHANPRTHHTISSGIQHDTVHSV